MLTSARPRVDLDIKRCLVGQSLKLIRPDREGFVGIDRDHEHGTPNARGIPKPLAQRRCELPEPIGNHIRQLRTLGVSRPARLYRTLRPHNPHGQGIALNKNGDPVRERSFLCIDGHVSCTVQSHDICDVPAVVG